MTAEGSAAAVQLSIQRTSLRNSKFSSAANGRHRAAGNGGVGTQWILTDRPVIITGGAGFIGSNLAHRLLAAGQSVRVVDNLSRVGVAENLAWLRRVYGNRLELEKADIRDRGALAKALRNSSFVFHCAAQVAVTSSLIRPHEDFAVNAEGTLNLLEALRNLPEPPPLLFTSTNKVYGAMTDLPLREEALAYVPADERVRQHGINETAALNFHSPYGCSKGCAEQYVLDYSHSFGLPSVVFRMSCIYGPFQCGNEDQGWVAHFASVILRRQPITIYGNGKQVRDLLFVDDLIDAMFLAVRRIDRTAGRAFNIGGGPANARSVLEVLALLGEISGINPTITFQEWRRADQRYYVSDTSSFKELTGWASKTGVREGIHQLCHWLNPENNRLLSSVHGMEIVR